MVKNHISFTFNMTRILLSKTDYQDIILFSQIINYSKKILT